MSSYRVEADSDPLFKAQRKTYLDRHRYCRLHPDEYVLRNERSLDHIIPMWRYNGDYWDKSNWQMLSKVCHNAKTKIEGTLTI